MAIFKKIDKFLMWMEEDTLEYMKTYVFELVLILIIIILGTIMIITGKVQ